MQKIVLPYFKREGDGWTKGGADKPRPLFNIPGVVAAESIAVVEGEKCAAALAQFGIPVTTSCGGAQGANEADWSPCISAKKIYLFPDADTPGEIYIDLAKRNIQTVCKEAVFFVLRIEELSDGADIIDWLQRRLPHWNGYGAITKEDRDKVSDELRALFKAAVPYPDDHAKKVLAELEADKAAKQKPAAVQKPDTHVADVKAALTFHAILSKYGKEATGTDRGNGCTRVRSPFGNDSNPSFDFNENEKWFNCFSTGKKGDVFGLIAELEGCDTKGGGWKRVIEVAESLTGLTRNKQERKSNVTSIATRLPLNLSSIAHDLLSINAEGMSAEDALVACDPILRTVAGSDGVQDALVFGHIKDHFKLKADFLGVFKKTVAKYRKELKEQGRIEKRDDEDKKPVDAVRKLYLELFPQFLGIIRKDIFSGDCLYWDESEQVYSPVLNQMKLLKSKFLEYGEQHNIRFFMSAVDYHFEEYASRLEPRLVIDVPEWDGTDYIKQLTNRVKLRHVEIPGHGVIDNEVLEEFIKEWHAKMWEKLSNPHVQNKIIVLKGDQGIGKDYWQAEQLGGLGQFMVPMVVEDSNKDTRAQLHQGLAVTISEFDRTVKQHTSTMKELLTAATTMIRLPYDARPKPRFVRCSFMASCNVDEVLRDYTGNRRYVLFDLEDIDRTVQFTPEQKLQVLAQGKALAKAKYRVSQRSEILMTAYIEQETPESPLELLLQEWDEIAQAHFLKLTPEDRAACERAGRLGPEGSKGFMPNRFMNDEKLLEKLSRKFGWNERYAVNMLGKAKRKGRVRFSSTMGSTIERGFFWSHPEADTPVTEMTDDNEIVTDGGDFEEINFL